MSSAMSNRQFSKAKLLALLGIIMIAAFLRLYRIDTIPPGDGHDPAYYGVDALQILNGEWPIFFPTNFGREALFSYLVALSVAIFGIGPLAVHLASAVAGIMTIPAVFLVVEELLAGEQGILDQYGGLLAALTTAISYWHLNWSRIGVRAVLVPLFVALTFFFLWRALRTNSKSHFVAAGLFLGLSMYTYQAARVLPLLVVLGFVYVVASRRNLTGRDLVHLAIVAVVAVIVFAPLGIHFLTHPGSFSQRIEQTLVFDASQDLMGNMQALWKRFLDICKVPFFQGEDYPVHGLVDRPTLNGFLSILFFAGLIISLVRIKRPTYIFILTWIVVMSVPALLSQEGSVAKRAIGTLPAAMALIAIGTLVVWDKLRHWAAYKLGWAKSLAVVVRAAIVAGFLYSAVLTYYDYFVVWAGDPDLFTHLEVGITAIGEYAGSLPPEEKVIISPIRADHPSVVYNSQNRPSIEWYDGQACLVLRERGIVGTTYIIVPSKDPNSLDLLHDAFPQGEIVAEGPLHYQQPYYLAFRVPPDNSPLITPSRPLEVNWANKIKLLGYDLGAEVYKPGDTIHVTLYYEAQEEMDVDYTAFAHLVGPDNPATGGPLWGQYDSEPCRRSHPTSTWIVGEIIRDKLTITIPSNAPPDDYELVIGFYLLETMTRLSAADAAGNRLPDDAALLRQLRVETED